MPSKVTYKSLYSLVINEIDQRLTFSSSTPQRQQLSRFLTQTLGITNSAGRDVAAQQLIGSIVQILQEALPQRIMNGLTVRATDPISGYVTVAPGKGAVGGTVFELTEEVVIAVPFDGTNTLFYVNLKNDGVRIDTSGFDDRLTLAKIVLRDANFGTYVRNKDDGSTDAYIVQFQPVYLYHDGFGKLEEDSKEFFKDNIGDILAETIVGTITLSEQLRITNTAGTLGLDSTSLKLYDTDGHLLSKFNQRGVYFYSATGIEMAKFTADEARIGNLVVTPTSIQSGNFVHGFQGFQIRDDGDVEFNNLTVRGTVYATYGSIGGFTITPSMLYGGRIQTSGDVEAGDSGVVMDAAGLRGYDTVLGQTFNLPTNGDAPTFSSGIIRSVIFEINTNAVLRTSETVGDGSSASYGILINNTGMYGVGANQTLSSANLKALIDGTVSLTGSIYASMGQIGSVTISSDRLSGGLIEGALIRSGVFETAATAPKIRIDSHGMYYQLTSSAGTYGTAGSAGGGFHYGDGTKYGSGITAYLFNNTFPVLAVQSELTSTADIRLYNRGSNPTGGTHEVGDLIVVGGKLKICTAAGSPGTFTIVGTQS
jgi:hypothetical protein